MKMFIGLQGYGFTEWSELIGHQLLLESIGHLWYLPTLFVIFCLSYAIQTLQQKKLDVAIVIALVMLNVFAYKLPHQFCLSNVGTYWIYFYIGFQINKGGLLDKLNKLPVLLAVLSFVAILIVGSFNSHSKINVLFSTLAVILLYRIVLSERMTLMHDISKNSYGIYLFHSPLIYYAYTRFPDINPVLMILWNFTLCGIVAYGITTLLRKTKLRFIIGE